MSDPINPDHYKQSPSGVECITITEHMTFNAGNAMKYLWRAGLKSPTDCSKHVEDLKKAAWYINREIEKTSPTFRADGFVHVSQDGIRALWHRLFGKDKQRRVL